MNVLNDERYREDVRQVAALTFPWERLSGKKLLISGASGMIGSFLIDVVMHRNAEFGQDCMILALVRNAAYAESRFAPYLENPAFELRVHDINQPLSPVPNADVIVHAASNTHPLAYATDPIGTMMTNLTGTYNLLNAAAASNSERFVFLSSVEVYGENRGDVDRFDESYCGYIDCNTLRAGYPESKRAGEAMCQAFRRQLGVDVVIPRLSRIYGPTMLKTDTKAISQFLRNGLNREDIVLKSEGLQLYSYLYVADAVSGILAALFYGTGGEAYNVADEASDIALKDLAKIIAGHVGKSVVFQLPDQLEASGYSKATKAIMNADKIKNLGWRSRYHIQEGIARTLDILSDRDE